MNETTSLSRKHILAAMAKNAEKPRTLTQEVEQELLQKLLNGKLN